jgi:hypothetical protein
MAQPDIVTIEDVQKVLPTKKGTITQEVVDLINKSIHEPEFQGESLLQSMATYENVMRNNSASIKEYIRALKFCAYLISMDDNYTEAYKKVFSDRDFVKKRMNAPTGSVEYRELTSAASRYRRSKLVVDILTLSQVPLDLMFTGARYKALGVLADITVNGRYDRDKINAAKVLLEATKGPENVKMELEVGPNSAALDMQKKLFEQLSELSAQQHRRLMTGEDISSVQKLGLTTEVIEVEVGNE